MRNIRRISSSTLSLCMASALFVSACSSDVAPSDGGQTDTTHTKSSGLSLTLGAGSDTSQIKLEVKQVACGSEQLDPAFYAEVVYDMTGDHSLKDELFILDPGCYDVIAIPLKADGTPSELCEPLGVNKVVVFDGDTTEIGLVSQCKGVDKGALDVFVLFNSPPVITGLDHDPDKFVSYCSQQQICAEFYDPDGDKVELEWTQISGIPVASGPTVVPGSRVFDPAKGTTTECVTVQHGGPGTVGLKVVAYDLMKDVDGNDWRVDNVLKTLGYPSGSSDSLLFPTHGMPSANCPCVPGVFVEQCDIIDNDCDGQNNEGVSPVCVCNPFQKQTCYEGPAGTENEGLCRVGAFVCNLDGSAFSDTCIDQVLPAFEQCDGEDNDCDGAIDEDFPAPCPKSCSPGTIESCSNYNGPAGTQGVGICKSGVRTCNSTGDGWAACTNPTLPAAEVCNDLVDSDCDGSLEDADECQTCQEPAGILKSTFCSDVVKYGAYSDGNCGTVNQVIDACSADCGALPAGVEISQTCSGTDLVATYSDGNCSTYTQIIGQCGGCQNPIAYGTLISQACSGYALVGTYADGNCGTYADTISSCSSACSPPAAGTLISQICVGSNLEGSYNDGACGMYSQVIQYNAPQCQVCPSSNTVLSQACQGYDLWNTLADGNCGSYQAISQACHSSCNPPGYGTQLSTYCSGVDLHGTYANGTCGTYAQLVQANSPQCGGGCAPANQYIRFDCIGVDLHYVYTDGACGEYTQLMQPNSLSCGGTGFCNDGVCSATESCSSCAADCGVCPPVGCQTTCYEAWVNGVDHDVYKECVATGGYNLYLCSNALGCADYPGGCTFYQFVP